MLSGSRSDKRRPGRLGVPVAPGLIRRLSRLRRLDNKLSRPPIRFEHGLPIHHTTAFVLLSDIRGVTFFAPEGRRDTARGASPGTIARQGNASEPRKGDVDASLCG